MLGRAKVKLGRLMTSPGATVSFPLLLNMQQNASVQRAITESMLCSPVWETFVIPIKLKKQQQGRAS